MRKYEYLCHIMNQLVLIYLFWCEFAVAFAGFDGLSYTVRYQLIFIELVNQRNKWFIVSIISRSA